MGSTAGHIDIALAFSADEWGRASLAAEFASDGPCHVLTYATFDDDVWWAKTPVATDEHAFSALYQHVRNPEGRQVIVWCGHSVVEHCIVPKGHEPAHSQEATIAPFTPSILYGCGTHELGLIIIPKTATKTLRNRIWRLKEAFLTTALIPFADALSHGRTGHAKRRT
jgi:hypothetical protein